MCFSDNIFVSLFVTQQPVRIVSPKLSRQKAWIHIRVTGLVYCGEQSNPASWKATAVFQVIISSYLKDEDYGRVIKKSFEAPSGSA
jgi:hypothetical protein